MKSAIKYALLVLCLLVIPLPGLTAAASNTSIAFSAEKSSDRLPQITFTADQATDLYAYDLRFLFDSSRLKLLEAKVSGRGFTVSPIVDEGSIRIAHTLLGPTEGMKGKVELVTLLFERVGGGDAYVTLSEAKLVDSGIKSTSIKPGLKVFLPDEQLTMNDIAGHWARSSIEEAVRRGFVSGYTDGSFRPDQSVTRAEFAAMIVRAMHLTLREPERPIFSDASTIPEWANLYAAAAMEAGLVAGYDDGSFRPGRSINRSEAAVILVRAQGGSMAATASVLARIPDQELIPDWARLSIASAYESGLVQGRTNGLFDPLGKITRAEAALLILRLLNGTPTA